MAIEKNIPKVNEGFINIFGQKFDNVREIAFKKNELYGNLGKYVTETIYEENMLVNLSGIKTDGVYIYRSNFDPFVAYRIYKCYADYGYNGEQDDKLIQELSLKKENIKLAQFPMGVVTLEGRIIGQEIPFFPYDITLFELFSRYKNLDVIKIYKAVLDVLNELYQNGIAYLDNHAKNFMINPLLLNDSKIDIIDFDYKRVVFDDYSPVFRKQLLENYRCMIIKLNQLQQIETTILKTDDFDDTFSQLDEVEERLVKR